MKTREKKKDPCAHSAWAETKNRHNKNKSQSISGNGKYCKTRKWGAESKWPVGISGVSGRQRRPFWGHVI